MFTLTLSGLLSTLQKLRGLQVVFCLISADEKIDANIIKYIYYQNISKEFPYIRLKSNLGEEEHGMKRNQPAAIMNMLCFSATDDISQFLNYSSSENVAYTMIPDSPLQPDIITPTSMPRAQI